MRFSLPEWGKEVKLMNPKRQNYTAPELRVHGSLERITLANGNAFGKSPNGGDGTLNLPNSKCPSGSDGQQGCEVS
jgi:hypothetical protein